MIQDLTDLATSKESLSNLDSFYLALNIKELLIGIFKSVDAYHIRKKSSISKLLLELMGSTMKKVMDPTDALYYFHMIAKNRPTFNGHTMGADLIKEIFDGIEYKDGDITSMLGLWGSFFTKSKKAFHINIKVLLSNIAIDNMEYIDSIITKWINGRQFGCKSRKWTRKILDINSSNDKILINDVIIHILSHFFDGNVSYKCETMSISEYLIKSKIYTKTTLRAMIIQKTIKSDDIIAVGVDYVKTYLSTNKRCIKSSIKKEIFKRYPVLSKATNKRFFVLGDVFKAVSKEGFEIYSNEANEYFVNNGYIPRENRNKPKPVIQKDDQKSKFRSQFKPTFSVEPKKEEKVVVYNSFVEKAKARLAESKFISSKSFEKKTSVMENFIELKGNDDDYDDWLGLVQ